MSTVLAVDGGQTQVRAALFADRVVKRTEKLPGLSFGAVGRDVDTIIALLDRIRERFASVGHIDTVALALTGMPSDPAQRTEIGAAVYARFAAGRVFVGSDVPAAYLGALGSRPGAVISAGSGSVAFASDGEGRTAISGGGAALLGDDGSGYWIGHQALREAWRVHGGRPGSRPIYELAAARYAPFEGLPKRLRMSDNRVADIAAFVPDVAAAASDGDAVATRILHRAGWHLAQILTAAARAVFVGLDAEDSRPMTASWNGRLLDQSALRVAFAQELRSMVPRLQLVSPGGSALDGAHMIAELADVRQLGGHVVLIQKSSCAKHAAHEGAP